ncbi:hypothetical protein SAMN05216360_111201 [Methylobacterium phyllostachyos]|uniref:Uncharacterized protein n=1 Tax=Methylobacterium phyllostachyos TaxID=582672 RepID=A0A1H0EJ07_9HYPH|nr:hypothetical protein [Methylobacterium phyllostachyos]SDN82321.1 hypothetical protein SAMN05216360_111201 [Methylobacterium phyllostachyos]
MRELDLWIVGAFVIILAWSLFGLFAFSHSYVMFLPLTDSMKYDDTGNTLIGAALFAASSAYAIAVLIRSVWAIRTWLIRALRVAGAAIPPA